MNNLANLMQAVAQIRQNPMSILGKYGIPQNIANDPQAIIQHLMNNGKITQDQYDAAIKQARNMGINI